MGDDDPITLVADPGRVGDIAGEIAEAGALAFDLEFASDGRYIPELSLVQVAWGAPGVEPGVAAIDCLAVDPAPILALIAAEEVDVVAHAAKQDLGLLSVRHEVRARGFFDTQIAAAFLGIGDQIGYGNLVERVLGVSLDKGAQFTAWLERPLSAAQLRYALDDVRYLPRLWQVLRERLEARGRLEWVRQESEKLASESAEVTRPEDAHVTVKGARNLDGRAAGAVRALATWRMREALRHNKPPSWILPDRAMIDLCRAGARTERDLRAVRGVGDGTVRRYGAAILERIAAGAATPPPAGETGPRTALSARGQVWASVISNLIASRCAAAHIAPRFVGTRAEVERLVEWFERGAPAAEEAEVPLLGDWRRELCGDDVLAWLRGEAAIVAEPTGPAALRLDPLPSEVPD